MRKYFCIIAILSLFMTGYVIPNTSEEIACDGYWWSTLNEWQKLGYVQGYMNAINFNYPLVFYLFTYSKEEELFNPNKYLKWVPFDKSFGYYMERIGGYYQTTKDLKREVRLIMGDLMNPVPQ